MASKYGALADYLRRQSGRRHTMSFAVAFQNARSVYCVQYDEVED